MISFFAKKAYLCGKQTKLLMMKKRILTLFFLASVLFLQAQRQRPNIILFMVDDMGWQDTSVPFWTEMMPQNERYHTPSVAKLADEGMKFTQAYASSVCSPTRVSLVSGTNAARHRVTNWTLRKDASNDKHSETLTFPKWNVNGTAQQPQELAYEITALPELLKKGGYHTIHCGKAHWGAVGTPGENPLNMGFEVNIAGHAAGGPTSYLGKHNFGNKTDGSPSPIFAIPDLESYWGKDIFATEALTQEAIKALNEAKNKQKPFFLYMAHYGIHVPIDKDMRFYEKYLEQGLSPKEAAYAALIEGVDKSLGDLMQWLKDNDLEKNTIVIFTSDNGGLAASEYWRDQPIHTQNAPLNSGKGSAYEGGIRVPMIVKYPDLTPKGSVTNARVIIEDFFPSILEIAQIPYKNTKQVVDGKSFLHHLKGNSKDDKKRSLYWNYPNLWGHTGPGIGSTCTIRKGDWKLIYYYETGKKELFNIAQDIGESKNLAETHPKKVRSLSKKLGKYLRKVDAQRPSFKADNRPCPWPDEV